MNEPPVQRRHLLAGRRCSKPSRIACFVVELDPEAIDGLVDARGLVDIGEDQLALAPCVARVDDAVDIVANHQPVDGGELLLAPHSARLELEPLRHDRENLDLPPLVLLAVGVGLGKLDEMPHGPRDDRVLALERRLVLALLELTGERSREIAPDGELLGDDERLSHGRHHSDSTPG